MVDAQASRKAYTLNAAGRALLAEQQAHIAQLIERLSSLAMLVNNRSIPDVDQAIHRMRTALNGRLSQEDISPRSLEIIIETLNAAAEEITHS